MGQEVQCVCRSPHGEGLGTVQLEAECVLFRGPFRLKIPFAELSNVMAVDGALTLTHKDESISFELGVKAEAWANKILNPPTLLDKLGIKVGVSVAMVGSFEEAFVSAVPQAGPEPKGGSVDQLYLLAADLGDIAGLDEQMTKVAPRGCIWIVYAKGGAEPTEQQVLDAGRGAGLTDVKVCRFSETHTALKFVRRRG